MSVVYAKSEGITLIGGGTLNAETLDRALQSAPWLVAADGGADAALAMGHRPDLTVGDLDSLSDSLRRSLGAARLHRVDAQDDTDFDKALAAVAAPFVLAVGFSGGRLDHTLAAMNTLARNPDRRVILDTGRDLCLLLPPTLALSLAAGTRVSLFPLGPVACTSEGLVWPVEGLAFTPLGRIGTSNRATGGTMRLTCDAPAMLLLVPPANRGAVLSARDAAPLWTADARAR
ncbi:MAG: thiamine diphosphokinase [Pararhodobacter sp.]|nr:thiamine diphosphokinase [Pararhodobacter sp.]